MLDVCVCMHMCMYVCARTHMPEEEVEEGAVEHDSGIDGPELPVRVLAVKPSAACQGDREREGEEGGEP